MQQYLEQKIKEIQDYIDTHELTFAEIKALRRTKQFMEHELLIIIDEVS